MVVAANDQTQGPLRIDDGDLAAYVDGRLDHRRRREVEGLLACNPDLAAQVMTQLHLSRGQLRPARRFSLLCASVLVGVAALSGSSLGWAAAERHDLDGWRTVGGVPPEYVEEAAEARQAVRIREAMVSQPESARLDADEVERKLKVTVPRLPESWRVLDVQVFPTDHGPGVAVVIDDGRRRLDLFAVRAQTAATDRPVIATRGGEAVAFWEQGDDAYVLSGPESRRELASDAAALVASAKL